MRTRIATLILAGSALALGGCAYGDLGLGMGYGGGPYSGYGYGSPYGGYGGYGGYGSQYGGYGGFGGYGSQYGGYGGYGGYGYGSPYGGNYGSGYGSPYYGWNDNYYYPGTGYYVYDTYRQPHVWSDAQRNYWTQRAQTASRGTTTTTAVRPTSPNWSAFNNRQQVHTDRTQARADRQSTRVQTRTDRQSTREQTRVAKQSERDQKRAEQQAERPR